MLNSLVLVLALASGVNERALREVRPVEHWTVRADGYAVTFYPGFASRVTVGGTELYRQSAPYNLGENAQSGRHLVRIAGGDLPDAVTLSIDDREHQIARLKINFYGNKSVVIDNSAPTCPPLCITEEGSGGALVGTRKVANSALTCPPNCGVQGGGAAKVITTEMLVPASFHGSPEVAVRANGYDVRVYPGFASSVKSTVGGRTTELYRQVGSYRLPGSATTPAGRHEVRVAGGPFGRNLTIGIEDDAHQIASIEADLHGPGGAANETLTITNDGKTCPPACGQQ